MLDEVLTGVWRDVARHPEWTEDEGGEDGWEPDVAWHAVATNDGLVLVDPLVDGVPVDATLVESAAAMVAG